MEFNDEGYKSRIAGSTNDELKYKEGMQKENELGASFITGAKVGRNVVNLGASTALIPFGLRRKSIAKRKQALLQAELTSRNIQLHRMTKRDWFIPVGNTVHAPDAASSPVTITDTAGNTQLERQEDDQRDHFDKQPGEVPLEMLSAPMQAGSGDVSTNVPNISGDPVSKSSVEDLSETSPIQCDEPVKGPFLDIMAGAEDYLIEVISQSLVSSLAIEKLTHTQFHERFFNLKDLLLDFALGIAHKSNESILVKIRNFVYQHIQ